MRRPLADVARGTCALGLAVAGLAFVLTKPALAAQPTTLNDPAWRKVTTASLSGGALNDYFGSAVAVSGDRMVVGSFLDDTEAGADVGSAHVYRRSGSVWSHEATLVAADGRANDGFGFAVGISGDTIVVGTYMDDTEGGADAGSAHVYRRSGSVWSHEATLVATDGAVNDLFGSAVAISGDTIVVGTYMDDTAAGADAGSAHVYRRSGSVWSHEATLTATDASPADEFGRSVAISGDGIAVGAPWDNTAVGANAGSAHVYSRSGTSWVEEAELSAPDGSAYSYFGTSVAISDAVVAVGAPREDVAGSVDAGAAYAYRCSGGTWSHYATLKPAEPGESDWFANAVAISGDRLVVGAPRDDTTRAVNGGAAYVYAASPASWSCEATLAAQDGAEGGFFGGAVAIYADRVAVGAPYEDTPGGANAGSAYLFGINRIVARVSGANRFEVAAGMARTGWDPAGEKRWPGVKHLVVACGEDQALADPLAASGLCGAYDAPLLLVASNGTLHVATQRVIAEVASSNGPIIVHIVGGTGSVAAGTATRIDAIPNVSVDRIAGKDRYEVTANIAKRMVSLEGTSAIPGVLIVCAQQPAAFYDALAASPIAFSARMPMLGVRTTSVPVPVLAELKGELAGKPVYVVSSQAFVSEGVCAQTGSVSRLATEAAYYTGAAQIASAATSRGWLDPGDTALTAKLSDALGGGAFIGKAGGVLLYTSTSTSMNAKAAEWAAHNRLAIARGWLFGGTGSIPGMQENQFKNLLD